MEETIVKSKVLTKKQKKIIITVAVILVALVGAIIGVKANITAITADVMYSLMPKSLEGEADGQTVTYYVERNPDFDAKENKDDVAKAFTYYYVDQNGNKTDLCVEGIIDQDGQEVSVSLIFMFKLYENFNNIKPKIVAVFTVIFFIAVAGLIVLWFRSWSKREDKKKELAYGNANKKNKKKK